MLYSSALKKIPLLINLPTLLLTHQMVYGQTPFADIPFIPKMNAICNPGHVIRFASCANPAAADAMARCLDREPRTRITIPVSVCMREGFLCLLMSATAFLTDKR